MTKSLEPKGFGETYASWVSRLRQDCSRRRKSARRTSASAFSSSAWPTPSVRGEKGANGADHLENGTGRKHLDQLPNFVEFLWRTPQAMDSDRGSNGNWQPKPKAGQHSLRHQIEKWSTPRSHEVGQYTRDKGDPEKERPSLTGQAFSHQHPATLTDGEPSSTERHSLNPAFVEWLMGWPHGWTGFACSATALCLWRQRMLGALSQLASPSAAPPAQLALFG